MQLRVHPKEKIYFVIMTVLSFFLYAGFFLYYLKTNDQSVLKTIISCFAHIVSFIVIQRLIGFIVLGMLRGNTIKMSDRQFPEIHELLKNHCKKLGMKKIPNMYLLQGGGTLNAFAMRLSGRNFVVLYSDVLEVAYQEGIDAVSFIIGHEVTHIYRNHVGGLKNFLIWPARWIPFLGWAYSRACEYTCDSFAYSLCPAGAAKGLLILAAGKTLYKRVQFGELMHTFMQEKGFAVSLAECFSTHPALLNRISVIHEFNKDFSLHDTVFTSPKVTMPEQTSADLSSYQPRI